MDIEPIPVSERLPPMFQDVLAFCRKCGWHKASWSGRPGPVWYMEVSSEEDSGYMPEVTHWADLPPDPS